jgi:hypothetical protein
MKWLIGVLLVATSPLIISGVILYLLVYRLPISAYELADELYSLRSLSKKHEGIGWYK